MARWIFETKLVRPEGVGTWTFAPIPLDIAQETGIKARLRVKGRIDGVPFAGTLLPGGSGRHFVVVKKEIRDRLGKSAGDGVRIQMDVDLSPAGVVIPDDLTRALTRSSAARSGFEGMAPSHKKAYVEWIEEAKKPATRTKRIAKALMMIAAGKQL
jgi:Bacteriocin-protection, YdeI or OmpD-Associated/Domain of unknown function (DUF1905)